MDTVSGRLLMLVPLRRFFVSSVFALGLLGSADPLTGTFALQDGIQKTAGHLIVRAQNGDPLARTFDFWMTRAGSSTPIRRYGIDMTKLLHVVIISDDFGTFVHAHPVFSANGHFQLDQRFERAALYHLYFDGRPLEISQQVFRFDVVVGRPRANVTRDLAPSGRTARAGPYLVTLDRTRLSTRGETQLRVHIGENGKGAGDLHPYLGTVAHAVFVDAQDLTYVHVHAMSARRGAARAMKSGTPAMTSRSGMTMMNDAALPPRAAVSPDMLLHVAVHEAGSYRLWLQFRGNDALHVASFTLTAR